jgi:hypothetical protein
MPARRKLTGPLAVVLENQPRRFVMKRRILIAATVALATASPIFVATARAADPSADTQPGFVPNTGQINPGNAAQLWSNAPPLPQDQQPAQEDARAALMIPDNGAPSAGQSTGQGPAQGGAQATPPAPNGGGQPSSETSSAAAPSAGPPGPIGATIQTMPAKFSHRNDVLDHMPVMAWPPPLNAQQRQQIYQAVMADKSPPAVDTTKLKPANALTFEQRRDMRPLPESLAAIDGLQGLKYVKGKDKVLLVRPSTGIVVAEVTM